MCCLVCMFAEGGYCREIESQPRHLKRKDSSLLLSTEDRLWAVVESMHTCTRVHGLNTVIVRKKA